MHSKLRTTNCITTTSPSFTNQTLESKREYHHLNNMPSDEMPKSTKTHLQTKNEKMYRNCEQREPEKLNQPRKFAIVRDAGL